MDDDEARAQCERTRLVGRKQRCTREAGHTGPHWTEDSNGVQVWGWLND